jgi:hypothetical protein
MARCESEDPSEFKAILDHVFVCADEDKAGVLIKEKCYVNKVELYCLVDKYKCTFLESLVPAESF